MPLPTRREVLAQKITTYLQGTTTEAELLQRALGAFDDVGSYTTPEGQIFLAIVDNEGQPAKIQAQMRALGPLVGATIPP